MALRIPFPPLWRRAIKRTLPKTLWGRSLLIIVLPVFLMQVAVTWSFFDAHWQTVTARLSDSLAGEIAWMVESWREEPDAATLDRLAERAEQTMQLSVALQVGRELPTSRRTSLFTAQDRTLNAALDARLDDPYWFDTTRYPAYIDIQVQQPEGVLRFIAPRERAFASQAHIFVLWLALATLLLGSVAILFIRNQVRAIERLSEAAEAFGRGVDLPGFKPHGAREVRAAAHAFIDMRERIRRHIDQRTALLASVSHDLRTPLTRLRLALALSAPGVETEAMKGDLNEMEHMIDEYLAFARGQAGEAEEAVDVRDLLARAAEDARALGASVTMSGDESLRAQLRPLAFRRAMANLVSNAATHARTIRLGARITPSGQLELSVEDDGPGIEPDLREEALRPFSRLDPSRNQNTKGVGLGLSIARDVARSHGGELLLDDSDMGGLKALIRIPLRGG